MFSVPTPWSPYATRNWNKYRYFTSREALALVSPDWRLADDDLVFQYPSYSHYAINSLPDRYQEPFVDLAWDLTDRLTARDWWGLASYLVCGVSPLSYSTYLDRALDCLFRPTRTASGIRGKGRSSVRSTTTSMALRSSEPIPCRRGRSTIRSSGATRPSRC